MRYTGIVEQDFQVKLNDGKYIDLDPYMSAKPSIEVKPGDKVVIIVIKQ